MAWHHIHSTLQMLHEEMEVRFVGKIVMLIFNDTEEKAFEKAMAALGFINSSLEII